VAGRQQQVVQVVALVVVAQEAETQVVVVSQPLKINSLSLLFNSRIIFLKIVDN
jgi:hypothetical protein